MNLLGRQPCMVNKSTFFMKTLFSETFPEPVFLIQVCFVQKIYVHLYSKRNIYGNKRSAYKRRKV